MIDETLNIEVENKEVKHIIQKEKIIEREVPIEKILEKLVEVEKEVIKEIQPKVNMSNTKTIAESLVAVNLEMENIAKNKNNPFFKSAYLDLSAISNTVRPILAKHGLSIMQYPINDSEGRVAVNTIFMHKSGEVLEFPGIFIKPSKMGDIQVLGSIITYLKRYEIMSLLFISASDEDDDGEVTMNRQAPNQQATPRAARRIRV